jgi:capsular polysaccharide transport system ATP-binding protein
VQFVCRVYGAHGQELRDKVRCVQDFAEIGDYFDLPMRSFSSGMRSRVAFGLSMAFDFDYYLIDEVMAVGDAQFRAKSKQVLMERLKSARVILTSHNMADIRQYCNVVVHVDQGRVHVYEDVEAGIRAYQGTPVAA